MHMFLLTCIIIPQYQNMWTSWGEPERAPYGIEKRPPRTIYLSMYLCMRTSFRKCPRALIHWTVQYFTAVNF